MGDERWLYAWALGSVASGGAFAVAGALVLVGSGVVLVVRAIADRPVAPP